MFTGIIEILGKVISFHAIQDGYDLQIEALSLIPHIKLGDSIAVNGCCLTVVEITETSFLMHLVPETIQRTWLGRLKPGHWVNLERALLFGSRLDGHLVQGHIDGTGVIEKIEEKGDGSWLFSFSSSPEILKYAIEKGSIAIDGISLTLATLSQSEFTIAVIPYTFSKTNLGTKKIGDLVNLEGDILGKYIVKYTEKYRNLSG